MDRPSACRPRSFVDIHGALRQHRRPQRPADDKSARSWASSRLRSGSRISKPVAPSSGTALTAPGSRLGWTAVGSASSVIDRPRGGRASRDAVSSWSRRPGCRPRLVFLIGFFVLGLLAYRTYTRGPADPRAGRRSRGPGLSHRRGHPAGPEGLPAQRPDGVRLDLRPRRLSRPGLHGRLPAPRGAFGARAARRRGLRPAPRSRRSRTSRTTATTRTPTRSPTRDAQARAFDELRATTTRDFFSNPTTEYGLRPERDRPIPEQVHDLTRLLRLVGLGGRGAPRPATTTPTRTTGRPRSWSTTGRPRTWSSGASSR